MKSKTNKNTEALLRIASENPELPIIAMVDSDVVYEDFGKFLGSIGAVSVGEYVCYNERYYDDREVFKEDYYCQNDESLCERFGYCPWTNDYALTKEQYDGNKKAHEALEKYLDEVAEKAFTKVIIVYICEPNEADYKEFKGEE